MNTGRILWLALLLALLASGQSRVARAEATDQPLLDRSLFADRKAYRPGDLLTVIITEVASANAQARTRADKQDSANGTVNQPDERPWHVDLSFGTDFTGGGQIQRSGQLLGKLAVVVEDVDSNGNLTVRGEQNIFVNNEEQRIALSGRVRAEDVGPDNTVNSSRIADAHIDFKGKGILARKQSPGLISKLFDLFGLN